VPKETEQSRGHWGSAALVFPPRRPPAGIASQADTLQADITGKKKIDGTHWMEMNIMLW